MNGFVSDSAAVMSEEPKAFYYQECHTQDLLNAGPEVPVRCLTTLTAALHPYLRCHTELPMATWYRIVNFKSLLQMALINILGGLESMMDIHHFHSNSKAPSQRGLLFLIFLPQNHNISFLSHHIVLLSLYNLPVQKIVSLVFFSLSLSLSLVQNIKYLSTGNLFGSAHRKIHFEPSLFN